MRLPSVATGIAVIAILAALLACTEATQTPTEAPTPRGIAATPAMPANTPGPAGAGATSKATSKPETPPAPTSTPTPTTSPTPGSTAAPTPFMEPTKTPGAEPVPEGISPILLELPQSVETEVPDSELACLAGTADAERLSRILTGTEEPAPEEMGHIMDCLQDETLLRMFLGTFVEYAGPLSPKTSECIRTSFAGIDPRRVMLAALEGNQQDGMVISAVILTIACLNEQEWNAAARAMDLHPDDRETMLCILKEMDGPEEMVAALGAAGQDSAVALASAQRKCGVELEDRAAIPALTATPTPTSSTTPEPTATPPPDGRLAPLRLQDSQALVSSLSQAELACIGDVPETLDRVRAWPSQEAKDEMLRLIGCLSDETLARLFLSGIMPGLEPLSLETSDCVRAAFAVIDPREVMTAGLEDDPERARRAMAASTAVATTTTACLNDQEWERSIWMNEIGPQERADQRCLMEVLGGPGEMAEAVRAAWEGDSAGMEEAAAACGLDRGPNN